MTRTAGGARFIQCPEPRDAVTGFAENDEKGSNSLLLPLSKEGG